MAATFDPSTTFPGATLPKHWAYHRCQLPPYTANTITFNQPGLTLDTTGADYGDDGGPGGGDRWTGLASAGWGTADPYTSAASFELRWSNFTKQQTTARRNQIGLAMEVPRIMEDGGTSHAGAHVFVGMETDVGGALGNTQMRFWRWDPFTGSQGTRTIIASVPINETDPQRVRLDRTGRGDFEAFYWSGGAWVSLGSFSSGLFNTDFMTVAIWGRRDTGSSGGFSVDIDQFNHLGGPIVPDNNLQSIDDDFEDGILPARPLWDVIDNGNNPDSETESNGYWQVGSTFTTSRYGRMQLRTFYPGTDIDVSADIEITSSSNVDYMNRFQIRNMLIDNKLNKMVEIRLQTKAGDERIRFVRALNGGEVILSDIAGGTAPIRSVVRLTRVGNVWSAYYDGNLMTSFTDTNGYLTDHPVQICCFLRKTLPNSTFFRWHDITRTKGDVRLITDETSPQVIDQIPLVNSENNLTTSDITFSITDDDTGVDITSTDIYINGNLIFTNSAFVAPWTGSFTVNAFNGYDFIISNPNGLGSPAQVITVRVVTKDIANNSLDTSWSFTLLPNLNVNHQINVNVANILAIAGSPNGPRVFHSRNQFDEHGSMVGLPRLREEKNWSYRRRIRDVFSNLANSSYRGLVNGITRELGLTLFEAIAINPKVDSNCDKFLAPDPYIKIDGIWVLLYSDFANNKLDWAIDRFEPGGNYEHLNRLVDFVNTTTFFEAHIKPNVDPYTRSMTMLNQSNRSIVTNEFIPQSTKFSLQNNHLVPGTVFFSNRITFRREVASEAEVVNKGDYYIDYCTGIVRVATTPTAANSVRYQYTVYPFCPIASPVILHDINNDNFKVKMFKQILQDDGTFRHGLPTEIGVDIINELMSVSPMYWGV